MTAEERAREIVSRRLSDLADGDWEPVIAEAVRAAEASEREGCAKLCDHETELSARGMEVTKQWKGHSYDAGCHAGNAGMAASLAAQIRARGTP